MAICIAIVSIAGCATNQREKSHDVAGSTWSGRLSLQVEEDPPKNFSAAFELQGSAAEGTLMLYTPLGGVLAVLRWSPERASLNTGNQVRDFPSAQTMVEQVTGTRLALPALFDWLAGKNSAFEGWQVDLSKHAAGKIAAQRTWPLPAARLRIVLDAAP